ncbi:MAG: type I-E CRISPR-associated endoribonuclease Cas2e [Acidaminococcales bacterium]|jgi:CRISPR-associated protein Cas2|nr:type I-E CRISPR-associated endoribonuclease Cas2e [Acidaminococcales bacterium]
MVVITLTNCPAALCGDLTKWLLEIGAGIFVGKVSARVRENIWERVKKAAKKGRATMAYSANNEQRLDFKVHNGEWEPIDFDGIKLMLHPSPARTRKLSGIRLGYSKASRYQAIKRRAAFKLREEALPASYVVVDIETSGLSARKDAIVEISALQVTDGKTLNTFSALIRGDVPISAEIEEMTGITNPMLQKEGRELALVLPEFLDFIGRSPIIAHNAPFDINFLNEACQKHSCVPLANKCIDTLSLSKKIVQGAKRHTLTAMAEYFGINMTSAHRALSDCFATKELYEKLKEMQTEKN